MLGKNKKLQRTTLICVFLTALLIGLFLSKYTTPVSLTWVILVVLIFPIVLGHHEVLIVYLCFAGLIIGWWRGGFLQIQNDIYLQNYNKNIQIVARATEDSIYSTNSQIQFMTESATINGKKLPGKILVKGFGEAMVYRHDIVSVSGKLYPAKGSKQANISFSKINVIARAKSPVDDIRRKFLAGMQSALPEPAASFGIGLLVGQRSLMPADVSTVLIVAGLTHIVAVSGYNLTIIVRAVGVLLKRFSRFQVLAFSLGLIYVFLLITGFSPSIIRATIVSVLALVAWYFGRKFRSILLILLAAAITAILNPYYVWGDIGWYLSFLAFTGVLILAPLITTRLFGLRKVPLIAVVAIEGLSAQLMTLPLIMMIFGRVSIVGLLANIVVVPLVPYAMLFSLGAGLAGMLVVPIAGWFALPARILLDVMLWVSAWFAKWPNAQVNATITASSLVLLYIVFLIVIIALRKRALAVKIKERLTSKV